MPTPRHQILCLTCVTIYLVGAGFAQPPLSNGSFQATGTLNVPRTDHTATLLPDGKVLVAGGRNSAVLNSAELYDPVTRTWSRTGSLNRSRIQHTAVLLPNGKVLVTGGYSSGSPPDSGITDTAELYDPVSGTWSYAADHDGEPRAWYAATLLENGKALVVGGSGGADVTTSCKLYDPASAKWSHTGSLKNGSYGHTATLLADGKVLVVGGSDDADLASILLRTEVFDPVTETWSLAGNVEAGVFHTSTLLHDGTALIAGGYTWPPYSFPFTTLYEPKSGLWRTSPNLIAARDSHTATLLADGTVLIAGGYDWRRRMLVNGVELYDAAQSRISALGDLITGRQRHTATLLLDGTVLIAGGASASGALSSAELFVPAKATVTNISAASMNATGVASEAIACVFGDGMVSSEARADSLPLPTELAGASLRVKDSAGTERDAPLFFVSPNQINYVVPEGTSAGTAHITITSADGKVSTGVMSVKPVMPALFAANQNGSGVAAAAVLRVKSDGSQQYEPVFEFDAVERRFISRPIDLGPAGEEAFLVLFGSGIRNRTSLSKVIVTVGGEYTEVSFAGPQPDFAGLDQINALLPKSLAGRGEVDVLLTVQAQMANVVRVNVK